MLQNKTFSFLRQLAENNNRDWFAANKSIYLDARADTEMFTASLIGEASRFDPTLAGLAPKECLFRIDSYTRFSKNKNTNKTQMVHCVFSKGRNANSLVNTLNTPPDGPY